MAKKFLVNIDLVQNQILNPLFQILASDPSSPAEGQFWYNSTADRFRYRASGVTYTPLVDVSDIPAGSIEISQLETDPLDRANHTGTQLLATISDVTATAAEVNVLDGVTATTAEINILDGVTATTTEINYVDGVTSNIQTQLDSKATLLSGASYTTATAIGTAAKTVAGAEPTAGSLVAITFTNGNSASSPTVAFAGGTARAIHLGGAAASAADITLAPGTEVLFFFDGTVLNMAGAQDNSDTTYPTISAVDILNGSHTTASVITGQRAVLLLDRSNHTGTQVASTISDFNTAVRNNRLDQMAAPTAAVSMNSQLITNVATPVSGTDAANKDYVDNAIAGLSWKEAVRVATTGNITLSGTQTIDGVSVVVGNRVLVKNQTTGSQNGVYIVAAGAWTRATDSDSQNDLLGSAMMVEEGTTNASSQWVLTTDAPITVGTTILSYSQFGGGTTYSAGSGLTLTGNTFSVDVGTGLTFSGNDLVIDTSVVSRKYSASVGNGSSTSIAVTHNLGTRDVVVDVFDNSTYDTVECDVVRTDTNTVTVAFAAAPTSNAYRVVVVG